MYETRVDRDLVLGMVAGIALVCGAAAWYIRRFFA